MNGSMKPGPKRGGIGSELELELGPERPELGLETFRGSFSLTQGQFRNIPANFGRNGIDNYILYALKSQSEPFTPLWKAKNNRGSNFRVLIHIDLETFEKMSEPLDVLMGNSLIFMWS